MHPRTFFAVDIVCVPTEPCDSKDLRAPSFKNFKNGMKNVSVNMLYIYAHFKINKSFLFHEIINYKIKLCPFFQRKLFQSLFQLKKENELK